MKKSNFTNISSPNLGIQSNLSKGQQNTKSAAAIFSNAPLEKKGPWLCAWKDPLTTIKTVPSCIKLADIKGDGEARLLIADQNQKLSIYKGVNIESESPLLEVPIALALFYSEISKNPIPNIAIVCESAVYIFKNLRPYFKFVLPSIEIPKEEMEVWNKFPGVETLTDLIKELNKLKLENFPLSYKSNDLLSCQDVEEQKQVFEINKNLTNLLNLPTCVQVIKKSSEEETALSSLILGTEMKTILILDSQGTSIIKKILLQSVPVYILAHGLLETDYRLIINCRDDRIYFIRNGELEANNVIDLEAKASAIVKLDRTLYVASMDKSIHAYNFRGVKVFSLNLKANILCLEGLEFGKSKQVKGILVALDTMEIRLYKEKQLIYSLMCEDVAVGMRFGYYGREDGCLISVFKSKGIDVKILQRQFTFSSYIQKQGNTLEVEEDIPLNIPKKTKLFLEDTQRERDQCAEIHRNFQKDLVKMRLKTAQAFYNMISEGLGPVSTNYGSNLRLHSSIIGLGPSFTIHLNLENISSKPLLSLYLLVNFDHAIYKLIRMPKKIPMLTPNIPYPLDIAIECVDPNGVNDTIKVYVCDRNKDLPLLGAIIQMPLSELAIG